jgi:hypothetical protein
MGYFPQTGDIDQTDFAAMQVDQVIELELTEEADNRFGSRADHIGHFFAGKGYLQDLAIIEAKGFHEDQQDFGQAFPDCFLGDIGDKIIGFAEFTAGELHEEHREGRVFPDQLEKIFRRDKTEDRIFDHFGGGTGEFLAEDRAETDDIAGFRKSDDLFLAIDAGFVDLDDPGLNAIETVDPMTLMVDDVAPFVQTAPFAIVH